MLRFGLLMFGVAAAAVAASGETQAAEASASSSWSGAYVGAMGAVSDGKILGNTLRADGAVGANASQESALISDSSQGGGVYIGYRKQIDPRFVAGIEADFLKLGPKGNFMNPIGGTTLPVSVNTYEIPWASTVRAVAGLAFGDLLVYGTGGVAVAAETERRTQYRLISGVSVPAFTEKAEATRFGLALGAGVEWRLGRGWSLRAEALHMHFSQETFRFPDARGGAQNAFNTVQGRIARNSAEINTARIGITYTFGLTD